MQTDAGGETVQRAWNAASAVKKKPAETAYEG